MIARRVLMIGAALGLTAWSSTVAAQPADPAALLATLMELEKASWQFVKSKNLAGMQNYRADDGRLIFGEGRAAARSDLSRRMNTCAQSWHLSVFRVWPRLAGPIRAAIGHGRSSPITDAARRSARKPPG